jgi:hypothetical protein
MEALARYSGGATVSLWCLGLATRGLTAAERVPTRLGDPAAYGQTQSPSLTALPGTPPSSFSFQPME